MAGFSLTSHVEAPVERTFGVFSDLARAPEMIDGITRVELLTEGPVGAGTRFRETRVMFGRETTEEMEVTTFEPGRLLVMEAESCGTRFRTAFEFRASGGGTDVDVTTEFRPISVFARLMSPLGVLAGGFMKKAFERDIEQLRAVAEDGG